MTRNHALQQPSSRGMLGRIDRSRAALPRPRGGPVLSLFSDSEDEGDASGTEPGDGYRRIARGVEQIDISDSDPEDDGGDVPDTGTPIDLTEEDEDDGLREQAHFQREVSSVSAQVIGAGIPRSHEQVDFATTMFGVRIRRDDTVECTDTGIGHEYTAFLRIRLITKDLSGTVYLHGILLKRHRDVDRKESVSKDYQGLLHTLLPNKKNEICAMLRIRHGSATTSLDSTLEVRRLNQVGLVRKLTFANKSRAELSGRTRGEFYSKDDWKEAEEKGDLFCRWKYIEEVDTKKKKVVAFQIRELEPNECDYGASITTERKFELFRGGFASTRASAQGASSGFKSTSNAAPATKRKRTQEVITIDDSEDDDNDMFETFERRLNQFGKKQKVVEKKTVRHTSKSVTVHSNDGSQERRTHKVTEEVTSIRTRRPDFSYADLCAGAGGTSAGAKKAGLKLNYLIDLWPDACKTMKLNFARNLVQQTDISTFATSAPTVADIVDVMHISFPCQGHSLLNRQQNPEQDAKNISVAYGSFGLILRKAKPRVVTLEQVAGIMSRSDGQHLRGQIFELVEAGYSVRWSLLNFADYGNAQARPRVITIAACPGQTLPSFPEITHGEAPGLKAPVTIGDILAQVPRHPPGLMGHAVRRTLPAFDPDQPLRGCITSGGGKSKNNYHPSGRRDFNLQELAQLQGFSADHRFYGGVTSVRKQIGNAVPPVFAAKLFKGIVPALEETDRKMEAWAQVIELRAELRLRDPPPPPATAIAETSPPIAFPTRSSLPPAIDFTLDDQESTKQAAAAIAKNMMTWYKGDESPNAPGLLPQPYYWWNAGAMFGSLIDYWYYTGDDTYNAVTTEAMLFQVGPDKNYMPPNQSKSLGNDDQAFWGMAAMSAAEVNFPNPPADQPQWLYLAQAVLNSQIPRWDDTTCGGGLRWQIFTFNNGYNYKNSISNGCFFNLAARMGMYLGNDTYFEQAEKAWDWSYMVGLINPTYQVYDGSDDTLNCTEFNHIQWSYNAGVYLLGAAVMWNQTTGDKQGQWRVRVQGMLDSAARIFFYESTNIMYEVACEPSGNCNLDQKSFKAYLARWMAATVKVAPWTHDTIMPLIRTSAVAAAKVCQPSASDGAICGSKWWDGTFDNNVGVGQQMSALEAIQSTLIDGVSGPVGNKTGGTSVGDPNAGTGGSSIVNPPKEITTADRAGAGILSALVLVGILGGAWWMVA
ncbi:unnamed protein product [Zymoseptoria tritici ST99CH_3D1]|nr:unnamed protein product [Zymoseptoria tritici ST99CH_3D1]